MMKKLFFYILLVTAATAFAGIAEVRAQENPAFSDNQPTDQTRPNLMRELNLSPDQLQQIRQLNQEKKPLMQAAQKRQRLANQLLDEAIYADSADDLLIQSRLREAQNAHAEVLRIRANSETAVRRILTPDQLVKFREIRQKFETARKNILPRTPNAQNPNASPNDFQNRRPRRRGLKHPNYNN